MTTPSSLTSASLEEQTETALKLWVVLNRANRTVADRLRTSVEREGLSVSEFGVLEVLYSKGRQLVGELGSRILLTSGSMTYVIDRLQERGLVQRRPCPGDRRALHVELTDQGRELIAQVFPKHAEEVRQLLGGLTSEEQQIATALIKRLGLFAQNMS